MICFFHEVRFIDFSQVDLLLNFPVWPVCLVARFVLYSAFFHTKYLEHKKESFEYFDAAYIKINVSNKIQVIMLWILMKGCFFRKRVESSYCFPDEEKTRGS